MAINIPVIPPMWPPVERDYPITPRENIMRALSHEKPVWMPNLYGDTQCFVSRLCREVGSRTGDGCDWFGTFYKWSDAQSSATPEPGLFDEIGQWREKMVFPDLGAIDWASEKDSCVRDPSRALYMRMSNGPFERLHMSEGFEQALIDLITEPDECRAFFERIVDYKIELFNKMRDVHDFDFIICADDYGTARAPFFSTELFEKTLLNAQRRFVEAVHARGTKFIAHCCGRIECFIPYFVNDIGFDGLELQPINDIEWILKTFGDRITVEYKADPAVVFNDEATEEQLTAHARSIVSRFGAQSVPGSGVIMNLQRSFEHSYGVIERTIYEASCEAYKNL